MTQECQLLLHSQTPTEQTVIILNQLLHALQSMFRSQLMTNYLLK